MSERVVGLLGAILDPQAVGGAERTALAVWVRWGERADITVLTTPAGENVVRATAPSVNVVGLGRSRSRGRAVWIAYALLATLWMLGHRSALTMTSSLYFYDIIPAAFARKLRRTQRLAVRIPHLILGPGERAGSRLRNLIAWLEQRAMLWLALATGDIFLVDNCGIADELVRFGIPRASTVIARQGYTDRQPEVIDVPRFDALYVGRRSPTKGTDLLANAWRLVEAAMPAARLVLAGYDDIGYSTVQAFADSIARGSVAIVDRPSDGQIVSLLRKARFFVMPSREEGFGRVILEALAEGTPCITFGIPAFRYAFPYGRVEAAGDDAPALARAMVAALGDSSVLARATTDARLYLTKTSWGDIANELWEACARPLP